MPSITGLISEAELGAQSVVYELATIAYMVRNLRLKSKRLFKNFDILFLRLFMIYVYHLADVITIVLLKNNRVLQSDMFRIYCVLI